jgi:CRISPR-associated protein (TIGR02584 family)
MSAKAGMECCVMMSEPQRETILMAVLGTSPSVLTETVWALAQESPPTLPDRIVVLTTRTGQRALESALFSGKVPGWMRLCSALRRQGLEVEGKLRFGLASDHVRVFPAADGMRDLDDIATSVDNAAAADFILRTLRAETEDGGTRVLASIAGGRKTMGALLMSCMSLLGREQDRVLHVLVSPPFDTHLNPAFLFPGEKAVYRTREGRRVRAKPRVDLIDVPFVKMRGWYEGAFKSAPPSYAALVRGVQRGLPAAKNHPDLCFDCRAGGVIVNGDLPVDVSPMEYAALLLIQRGVHKLEALADAVANLCPVQNSNVPDWMVRLGESSRSKSKDVMDISKVLSSVRAKLYSHPLLQEFADVLVPKRGRPAAYPAKKIHYKHLEILRISADI